MPMSPCAKCFENYWSFQKIEDIVRATCQLCGHEVEFASRKGRNKKLNQYKKVAYEMKTEGQPCRVCQTPVVKRIPKQKAKRLYKQEYFFEWYLYCPKCRQMYMVEEAKRFTKDLGILDKIQMLNL